MSKREPVLPSSGSILHRLLRRLALRHEARQDYQRARGTTHKKMLLQARKSLQAQLAATGRSQQDARRSYEQLTRSRDRDLTHALVRHLVDTQLSQVHGIGPKLSARISRYVFRGQLTDLNRAYRLEGIGPQRQQAISDWVRQTQVQLPHLLRQDFPGKSRIMASYRERIGKRQQQIKHARQRRSDLQALDGEIEKALLELSAVTWHEFHQALLLPEGPSQQVRDYIIGVFAAWEPMPDWFQRAVALART